MKKEKVEKPERNMEDFISMIPFVVLMGVFFAGLWMNYALNLL